MAMGFWCGNRFGHSLSLSFPRRARPERSRTGGNPGDFDVSWTPAWREGDRVGLLDRNSRLPGHLHTHGHQRADRTSAEPPCSTPFMSISECQTRIMGAKIDRKQKKMENLAGLGRQGRRIPLFSWSRGPESLYSRSQVAQVAWRQRDEHPERPRHGICMRRESACQARTLEEECLISD